MVKNIIFDFDGVILDAVPVKTEAFRKLFQLFPSDKLERFIAYHLENGGMPRYDKIRYFFEVIVKELITEEEVSQYAKQYSQLTKKELCKTKYQILETVEFIKNNHTAYNLHIASGADELDLKEICTAQNLNRFFQSIHGSPVKKDKIVKIILEKNFYLSHETILIGDSVNDYRAAEFNGIKFFGYNNITLGSLRNYIKSFKTFELDFLEGYSKV